MVLTADHLQLGAGNMEQFWQEVLAELPTTAEFLHVTFRLIVASILGALPGMQREHAGQPAGLRTHMLVSLGAAIFMMAAVDAGASPNDMTRVVQGLATGIGFVGAGAVLKMADRGKIKGLTTAASIWLTASIGTAVGSGQIWLPVFGSLLALLILSVLHSLEKRIESADLKHE